TTLAHDLPVVGHHLGAGAAAVRGDPPLVDAADVVAHVREVVGQLDLGGGAPEQHRLGGEAVAHVVPHRPAGAGGGQVPLLVGELVPEGEEGVPDLVQGSDDRVAVDGGHVATAPLSGWWASRGRSGRGRTDRRWPTSRRRSWGGGARRGRARPASRPRDPRGAALPRRWGPRGPPGRTGPARPGRPGSAPRTRRAPAPARGRRGRGRASTDRRSRRRAPPGRSRTPPAPGGRPPACAPCDRPRAAPGRQRRTRPRPLPRRARAAARHRCAAATSPRPRGAPTGASSPPPG